MSELKTCNKCGAQYEPYGQRMAICRSCRRAYDREFHKNRNVETKARKHELQKIREKQNKQYIWDYLKIHPCEVCGEPDPVVLEFDHLDQNNKRNSVSVMYGCSLETIKKEIGKCRVLCANCHRRRTALQLGWYNGIIP